MKEERQASVEAILKSGNIPAGMELFTAGNESQLQTIMRWIDESDIYLLLLGGRYGSVEPSSGLGYTEVEYDYAVSQKKPYFAVVITESGLDKKIASLGKDAIEQVEGKKLKEFRDKVLSNISSFYNEPKEIKLAIHETLQEFRDRYNFSGWISGKDSEKLEILMNENRELRLKLDSLDKQLAITNADKNKESIPVNNDDSDFEDLFTMFSNMTITTNRLNTEQKEITYSILDLIVGYKTILVSGVYNKLGMTDKDKFFFFNLFPKIAIHDLAESESVNNVAYRRFSLTKKGRRFLAFIDKKMYKPKQ
jgi:hypothetical protein